MHVGVFYFNAYNSLEGDKMLKVIKDFVKRSKNMKKLNALKRALERKGK